MKQKWFDILTNTIMFTLVPILLFYLMEAYEHNAFAEVRPLAQFYNIVLLELIAWGLLFLTGRSVLSLRIETGIVLAYGLVNHYVMAFRSTPFVPWDIFSIKTAASVVGNYDFTPGTRVVVVTLIFAVLFFVLRWVRIPMAMTWKIRLIPFLCMTMGLCMFVNLLQDKEFQTRSYLYPHLFTPAHMTKVNGMAVTFAMDMAFVYVQRPQNYSVEKAEELLAEYEEKAESTAARTENLPNVIVIMNEAFSDLSVLGKFAVNEDYMPFVHSLQHGADNTRTGNMEVSVCGGNTANTEFEFLTGHTMDEFPTGSIPYQQYLTAETPSLASHLAGLGYQTCGMHPYYATGWKRDEVYPMLGFERSYFLENFENRTYLRTYVSDAAAYQKIITTFEEKEEGVPLFVFEVTMQNHGGYTDTYENFTNTIVAEELNNHAIDQYLSLIRISDNELKKLVEYFSQVEEDTVILFFGDHQPSDSIANPILRLNGKKTSELTEDEVKLRYQVPYVMWANFEIEEAISDDIDSSFLSAHLLDAIGVKKSAYQTFLLELEQAENDASVSEETLQEYRERYEILQYYYMFDYKEGQI